MPPTWDYLILTASNDRQAAGYEGQLEVRRRAGLLPEIGTAMVVADPQGKRVGSGGSTLYCLMWVVAAEVRRTGQPADDWQAVENVLRKLRILILHAGGDSRRVPAYGPCGKIFAPVPGKPRGEVISTLFDRLYPIFRDMPPGVAGAGQVIVAAGDVLPLCDLSAVRFDRPGMVALGAYATPEEASKHGVFCVVEDGRTRLYLQKPSPSEQHRLGAIDSAGRSVLDIGIMSFDAATALALFRAFDVRLDRGGAHFSPEMEQRRLDRGMDIYREVCCALGCEATAKRYKASCRASGSTWPAEELAQVYDVLSKVPFSTVVLPHCEFLHFGTTRQLITSGTALVEHDGLPSAFDCTLSLNNRLLEQGRIRGGSGWVEGCRIAAPLTLAGQNVLVGVDVDSPLKLPNGACLDVIAGRSRTGGLVWFVRVYHIRDTFKDTLDRGGTLAGMPLTQWLDTVGIAAEDVWTDTLRPASRSLWDARVFPAVAAPQDYRDWLWMFGPSTVTAEQKQAFLDADRYSLAEIALLADMDAFYARRTS